LLGASLVGFMVNDRLQGQANREQPTICPYNTPSVKHPSGDCAGVGGGLSARHPRDRRYVSATATSANSSALSIAYTSWSLWESAAPSGSRVGRAYTPLNPMNVVFFICTHLSFFLASGTRSSVPFSPSFIAKTG